MRGHGRPSRTIYTPIFSAMMAAAALFAPMRSTLADNAIATESLPIAWQDDAELTDVCFIDRETGWAVGAQGVILRTTDGGKTWLQPSDVGVSNLERQVSESMGKLPLSEKLDRMQQGPQTRLAQRHLVADASRREVRIRFESVHFIDSLHGWAAGGYNVPWMEGSRGLIMRTSDGGRTWGRINRLTLPRVNKIRFTDRRTGWAIGETNALYPDGIYFTNDGGANWSAQSTTAMNAWIAGQQTAGQFVLIDQERRLGSVLGGELRRPALIGCSREDRIDCLTMVDYQTGYAVGQDGLILKTTNGGGGWKRLPIRLKTERSIECMAINGQHIFLGLASGGMVRVGLQDQRVEPIDLPTSLPMHRVQFVDQEVGFAVGDLGIILGTTDGGRTWRKQRGDHDRLAILFVADRPEAVSLSLMAYNAGEESRLCGTFLLNASPQSHAVSVQAFERVGSAVNWRSLPSRSLKSDNIESRDIENQNFGGATRKRRSENPSFASALGDENHGLNRREEDQRLEELVAAIRSTKPLVVACCLDLSSADRFREAMLLQDFVNRAIEQAADVSASNGQQNPWQVWRLAISDLAGAVRLDSRRMMPSIGLTVADQIAVSRTLLGQPLHTDKFSTWRVTHPAQHRPMKGSDLLSGLARKATPIPTRKRRTALGNLNRMNATLNRQRQTDRLVDMTIETDRDLATWRQALLAATATADEKVAGLWLVELAERYLELGRFDMVDRSLEALTTYWSDHAFAPAANAWLTLKRSQDVASEKTSPKRQAAQQRVLEPFLKLNRHDPALVLDPAWQWIELNVLARTTGLRSVEPKLTQMLQLQNADRFPHAFANLAQEELLRLRSEGRGIAAIETDENQDWITSTFTSQRPKLDGKLDDGLWREARSQGNVATFEIVSSPGVDLNSDEIVFAHDDQFFYGAIQCQKLATGSYRHRQGVRTRDPDLSREDRVELVIDPHLNYCGGIKLVIDHQGWVAESKLAGKNWNPDWYVAADHDQNTWTVEFAIPLTAIAENDPSMPFHETDRSSRGWAVKIARWDGRSRAVWNGLSAITNADGLQANLKPDPTGFRRLVFDCEPDSVAPMNDHEVQPAQFELELEEPNRQRRRSVVPPNVPNFPFSQRALR